MSLRSLPRRCLALVVSLLLMGGLVSAAHALDAVTLQLKWSHAFQFAGYYAAKEKGFYRDAGLDVAIEEARPGSQPLQNVLDGKAQYGVGNSSLLLARNAGQPVVVLAAIFQHSPMVLIARQKSSTQGVHDLAGKRMMIEPQSDELLAYLKQEGIPLSSITSIEHSYQPQDLIDGKVDAISAYVTNEPYYLDLAGFAYHTYTPRSAGIDFYGDNLYTTERELNSHPGRVKAFREASLRGWQYAIAHPEEIADLIIARYSQEHPRDFYLFEARHMLPLLHGDLIEIGYMSTGRWRHIANTYADLGLLPRDFPLEGFLYQIDVQRNLTWLYFFLVAALLLAAVVCGIALYIYGINRRLKQSMVDIGLARSRLQVLSMALEQSPTSVLITGADNIIEYVNPHFTRVTGYSSDEAIGQTPKISQSGLTDAAIYREMWAHLMRGEQWNGELVNRRKSGEAYWEEVHIAPVKDADGQTTHYVAVKLDITERKEAHLRLAYMAHHDALTNLPNRGLFFEHVVHALSLANRNANLVALMFIDLDNFKPINDSFGHAVGDLVLQEAARRMSDCLRDSDTVGRIGGDEFVVLLSSVGSVAHAVTVAEKIRTALRQPYAVAERDLSISASIGIAIYPEHGSNEIELAKNADFAMYHAKASGRDNVKVFSAEIPASPALR